MKCRSCIYLIFHCNNHAYSRVKTCHDMRITNSFWFQLLRVQTMLVLTYMNIPHILIYEYSTQFEYKIPMVCVCVIIFCIVCLCNDIFGDDAMAWKCFLRYWLFGSRNRRLRVDFSHKVPIMQRFYLMLAISNYLKTCWAFGDLKRLLRHQ